MEVWTRRRLWRQCVTVCAGCGTETVGGDKVVLFRRIEGEVEYLCEACYRPYFLKEHGREMTKAAFKKISRLTVGKTKMTLKEIARTAFGKTAKQFFGGATPKAKKQMCM